MADFVKASHVFVANPAKTVDEALEFFSKKMVELGYADDEKAVLDAFKARESEGTTGMSDGFAIPHAKSDAIKQDTVLVAKFAGDIEWESMDKKPIKVAIAICTPASEGGATHLQLLSDVAIMLTKESFRSDLLASDDPEKIAKVVNGCFE
ncbi:MAG: PTS fructose transporter subunit IIA [Coriobacteriaceae bacterium]|jgi:PTS system fructose-specific IIA component|nr:MAG: PTS fructose transporter subunit IIA [Coriobacteriaceae bacterium]